jgi:DNA gyrase/topoisomerase IV subunit A
MIEREPITVIMSKRGWIRAMKGHVELSNPEALKFKEGDASQFFFHAHTTDKLLLASTAGRFYTLAADKLPGGRGFGEPVKLMVDIEGEGNIVALFAPPRPRSCCSPHRTDAASSPRPPVRWPRRERASRSSICGPAPGSRS